MTENMAARGLAGLVDWLREQSEELMKSAIARESTAETMRAATPQELRSAKALAEKMAGRKLPNVSTGSEEAKIEADVQCRIAAKLDSKARQIAIWADELAATRKALQFYADPQTYGLHGGGVERILNDSGKRARTALEAAAPPRMAPRHELRTEILRVYVALHFDPEEHGWPRVAGVYSTYEAAESRVEELGCGATQSLHLNKPVRLAVPAATQEQPAGSEASEPSMVTFEKTWQQLKRQMEYEEETLRRVPNDWPLEKRTAYWMYLSADAEGWEAGKIACMPGSPRKVGEDGGEQK